MLSLRSSLVAPLANTQPIMELSNADRPILVTDDWILTEGREQHSWKAPSPLAPP